MIASPTASPPVPLATASPRAPCAGTGGTPNAGAPASETAEGVGVFGAKRR